jgi:hypothetical protein
VRITNQYNLPESFVRFEKRHQHSKAGADFSVTEIIDSPRISKLKSRYYSQIEEDISTRIMSILGTAVHNILEQGASEDSIVEERLHMNVNGVEVSGQIDLQTETEEGIVISDYKTCGAFSLQYEPTGKKSWAEQLNCYAALAEANGKRVASLEVVAVIRDWTASGLKRSDDYPPRAVMVVPIDMWEPEKRDRYLADRVARHSESGLRDCSDEERWKRPDQFAVYGNNKDGSQSKRATRVLDSPIDAEVFLLSKMNGVGRVKARRGENIRCQSYCPVSDWCAQWKEIQEKDNG